MGWDISDLVTWPTPPFPLIQVREKEDVFEAIHPFFRPLQNVVNSTSSSSNGGHCNCKPLVTQSLPTPNSPMLCHPVFIATDASSPHTNPSLTRFHRTLPCIYFLSDFSSHLSILKDVVNEDDGLRLEPFLLPFVDSMVAAMAKEVIGTPRSTFSRFTVDVLHRLYWGLEIVERGR